MVRRKLDPEESAIDIAWRSYLAGAERSELSRTGWWRFIGLVWLTAAVCAGAAFLGWCVTR